MEGLTANFEVLIVVSVMFAISLGGAYILFRFLESQATIQKAGYKAGGALAGFLIILGILFGSYHKLVQAKVQADAQAHQGWIIIGECQAPIPRDDILVNMVEPEVPSYLLPRQERQFLLKGVQITPQQLSSGTFPILQFTSDGLQSESLTLTKENVRIDVDGKRLVIQNPIRLQPALTEEAAGFVKADANSATESM